MTFVQFLCGYFNLNLLIAVAFSALSLFDLVLTKLKLEMRSSAHLQLSYAAFTLLIIFSLLHPLLPTQEFFEPTIKVWSAKSINSFTRDYHVSSDRGFLGFSSTPGPELLETDYVALAACLVFFVLIFSGAFFLIRDLRLLLKLRRSSFLIRRIGAVHLYINDLTHVPFSYWSPL